MHKSILLWFLLLPLTLHAQKSPEQLGGVYYAYPVSASTPVATVSVPAGYEPFYIAHYGRHGSRWLPNDERYEWVLEQFTDTQNLTPLGKSVRRRLQKVWKNARGNGGKLTPLVPDSIAASLNAWCNASRMSSLKAQEYGHDRALSTDAARACSPSPIASTNSVPLSPST